MSHLTCPKCGSKEHTCGFGLAAGPMGSYVFCNKCDELIDFSPDTEGMSDEFVQKSKDLLDSHMKPMWGDKYDEVNHCLKPEAYNVPERLCEVQEVTMHVTPKIDETCDHVWDRMQDPDHCVKCNLSFARYIFSCCP